MKGLIRVQWKHCNINVMFNNDVAVLVKLFRIDFLLVLYFKVLFCNFYILIIKLINSLWHFFRNNVAVIIIICLIVRLRVRVKFKG